MVSGWESGKMVLSRQKDSKAMPEPQRPITNDSPPSSGGRVSNTWITYPLDQDNTGKLVLIPDKLFRVKALKRKGETH